MITIRNTSLLLGGIGGLSSITLWIVFNFYNPYSDVNEASPMVITFSMLFLPACLALVAIMFARRWLMLIAFVWSLPFSLYLVLTPGIFALFGATCIIYWVSFLFMKSPKNNKFLAQ